MLHLNVSLTKNQHSTAECVQHVLSYPIVQPWVQVIIYEIKDIERPADEGSVQIRSSIAP